MATNIVTKLSASGHLMQDIVAEPEGSGAAGENLILGSVIYLKTADTKLWKHTGAEDAAAAIVGISDNSYTANAAMSYWQNGDVATGLMGLTAGAEYWSKEDGTLALYSGVGSGQWTRPIGVAISTTAIQVQIGNVIQKP